ncbi:NAD-dependent succinate-semialdehyde dehydrogenase [Nocardia sp. PE-7]|uniref:NAD-dependent succinate-semialdehyde dehydrogenase n=1 Tax=Nocardia sp. PE-7 TaxID=3058426 RepID=UPI00265A5B93|nr:NAD-dependent succinate-semialdehyde dehydrogenase [Nocardia sp. PE-7]WKG13065.1 NAD-dependent succinate-semialdehyde dehydrogenase [Nocardia sp. PE-7]
MAIATVNPADNSTVEEFDEFTEQQVDAAVEAADTAYASWRHTKKSERAAILGRAAQLLTDRADELAPLLTLEMGKLIGESRGEVALASAILQYYADNGEAMLADESIEVADGSAIVRTAPIGVLLGVMPWNFPLYQVVRFAGPNLMLGNTVLIKHASNCPQSALALERLFSDAGAPAGVYTNIFVSGSKIARIIGNPTVKGVSLTGSEAAGASVGEHAGKNLKKSVLELGGSDPFIVLDDGGDFQRLIEGAATGRLANTGQSCVASKRFFVVDSLYERFVDGLARAFHGLKLGDPQDPATTLGPLSSEQAVEDLGEIVRDALDRGASAHVGGHRVDRPGAYFAATVLTGVTADMRAFSEELFGPVAVVHRVRDADDAVRQANASSFGLGATVFSGDVDAARSVADRLDSGMVWINHPTGTVPELPFGGVKRSGFGRELSHYGIGEFANHKLIRTVPAESKIAGAGG